MALKSTIAAALAAVTMLLLPAGAAEAKTRVVIGIGTPGWGVGYWNGPYCGPNHWRCRVAPRYGYYRVVPPAPVYYYGYAGPVRGKVSCGLARNIVDGSGYNNVRARDCSGRIYSFTGTRKGLRYVVRVNAYNGRIIGSGRI
jgi:hypothetical protein